MRYHGDNIRQVKALFDAINTFTPEDAKALIAAADERLAGAYEYGDPATADILAQEAAKGLEGGLEGYADILNEASQALAAQGIEPQAAGVVLDAMKALMVWRAMNPGYMALYDPFSRFWHTTRPELPEPFAS